MEQAMNYVSSQIDYTIKLRYILVNIISMIPDLQEINIDMSISNDNQFRSKFKYNNVLDYFYCKVELSKDKLINNDSMFDKTIHVKDLYNYLYMYGIQEHELFIAKWIFITLHELGHIHFFYKSRNYYGLIKEMNVDYYNNLVSIRKEETIDGKMDTYFNSASELIADKFAYRYFYYVWQNLKMRGLI